MLIGGALDFAERQLLIANHEPHAMAAGLQCQSKYDIDTYVVRMPANHRQEYDI
jgi:hypothetical protein